MLYKINCKADIAAQSATYPTYKGIDCDLHINANDDGFYGRNMDCNLSIITTLADACIAKAKGIRTRVTINNIDVTAALKGDITIQHNKNMISIFSLQLGDSQYSPLRNINIALNKIVVITTTINGFEVKMFTGLIDDINVDYSLDNFSINISGSDYGKKLRDKRMTLVSIQDSAISHYRGALIKYLANQADIDNVNAPAGSYTRIDHSFNSQSILDMITKELTIDSYWWRFDENGILQIALDSIKTNTTTYPTADWTYGEDQITRLSLVCVDADIINSIKVLGTMYETKIEVDNPEDSPSGEYIEPPLTGYVDTQLAYFSNNWAQNVAIDWNAANNNFTLKSNIGSCIPGGAPSFYTMPPGPSITRYCFKITWSNEDYEVTGLDYTSSEYITVTHEYTGTSIAKIGIKRTGILVGNMYQEGAGSLQIGVRGKYKQSQSSPQINPPTSAIVDNEMVNSPTYEYHYDQVGAEIIDSNSIAKYGEKKAEAIEFPLAENTDQCKGIGKKIIRDSHRLLKQPDFEVGLNPLLKIGQTIQITDKKTGHSANRWYVEEVFHTIGQGSGSTRVGCVYYA